MTSIKYDTASGFAAPEIPPVNNFVVVTPTIGGKFLKDALRSVSDHTLKGAGRHLVVFDGVGTPEDILLCQEHGAATMMLPWNVGRHGFYGHRIYAAIGHLINADAVFFLDEDNYYDFNHIPSCMAKLNKGYDFVHSYRNVIDNNGILICKDRFEAIGKEPLYLVDTSSYCFRTEFLKQAGHLWHWGWGADRRFFQIVKEHAKYTSTGEFTLNYRLDGNPNSPTKDFFFKGNMMAGFTREGE